MKYLIISVLTLAIWGCSGKGVMDPTLFNEGFKGITYTNEDGVIVGPIDRDDWRIFNPNILNSNTKENYASIQNGLSHGLPVEFEAHPAYPNPNNGVFTVELVLPTACDYSVTLVDNNYRIISQTSNWSEAGIPGIGFVLDENVPPGIYRVLYTMGGASGYGDVWIKGK